MYPFLPFVLVIVDHTQGIDHDGASIAKQKKNILAVLTNEKFYSVHSKAQRKVPLPEDLDLDAPFVPHSLDRLLEVDIPENLQLAALYLVRPQNQVLPNFELFRNDEDSFVSKAIQNSMTDVFEDSGPVAGKPMPLNYGNRLNYFNTSFFVVR